MSFFNILVESYSKVNIHDSERQVVHAPSSKSFYNDKDELENRLLVPIHVENFDKKFKNDWAYVGKGGSGGIKTRYGDFGSWLKDNPDTHIEAPLVGVDTDGNVSFTNGRHRYAYMRDNGVSHIPVSLSHSDYQNAVKHNLV